MTRIMPQCDRMWEAVYYMSTCLYVQLPTGGATVTTTCDAGCVTRAAAAYI